MAKILERMRWREIPIGVTSAFGASSLLMGEIGAGAPGVLITAGIHGDEGPWGAWAIQKLLSGIGEDELRQKVLDNAKVQRFIEGKTVVRFIQVPHKLVNVVVRDA